MARNTATQSTTLVAGHQPDLAGRHMPLDVGPCAGTEAYINVIAVLLGFNWGLPDSDGCAEAQLERSGFTETLADLSATHLDVPSVAIRASCAVDDVNRRSTDRPLETTRPARRR